MHASMVDGTNQTETLPSSKDIPAKMRGCFFLLRFPLNKAVLRPEASREVKFGPIPPFKISLVSSAFAFAAFAAFAAFTAFTTNFPVSSKGIPERNLASTYVILLLE